MNENYELANERDPDFDKPHPYSKSYGDGSPRGYCRCLRPKDDPMHNVATTGEDREMNIDQLRRESNRINNEIISLFEKIDRLEFDKALIDEQIDSQSKEGVL